MAKKQGKTGKNRRDAHGVYERKEARGKGPGQPESANHRGTRNGNHQKSGRKDHYNEYFEKKQNAGYRDTDRTNRHENSKYARNGIYTDYSGKDSRYANRNQSGRNRTGSAGWQNDNSGKEGRRNSVRNSSGEWNRTASGSDRKGTDFRRKSGRNDEFGRPESENAYRTGYRNSIPEQNLLVGRNPVIEALRAGRDIERIFLAEGAGGSISVIRALAKERSIPISMSERNRLNEMAPGEKHQGVIAEIPAYHYSEMEDIFRRARESGEPPFLVILDEITDPHNVGAIIRSAECMGAHGIIIPNRRACGLTSTVAKSAAGAIERIPVVRVTNISDEIRKLQGRGIWVAACDLDGTPYYDEDFTDAIALVIGNEGRGISRRVRESCDFAVSIPMKGQINSLNASNAAAIVMSEVRRKRDTASN